MIREKSIRIFSVRDDIMLELVKLKKMFFVEDKADFVAYDADFNDPFETNWTAAIAAAEAIDDDETTTDQLRQLTETVEAEMASCRRKFQDAKYFIQKAFPFKKSIHDEFGFNDYNVARQIQTKLIVFMKKFHRAAVRYSADLMAKNYTQAQIDDILACATALEEANLAQEAFKMQRKTKTQDRIEALNTVWLFLRQVGTAGKNIYYENYAKYNRYLLPRSEESSEAFSIFGIVTDSANSQALANAVVQIAALGLDSRTDSEGHYGFGGLTAGSYELTVSLDGYTTASVTVTLTEGGSVEQDVGLLIAG